MGPLFYFTVKFGRQNLKRIPYVEFALKWIMFFGILSVVIISLNMKYNA
jgi:4-hydroxybenzoate polyprenyltransferase